MAGKTLTIFLTAAPDVKVIDDDRLAELLADAGGVLVF